VSRKSGANRKVALDPTDDVLSLLSGRVKEAAEIGTPFVFPSTYDVLKPIGSVKVIEYHHHIGNQFSSLAGFLSQLEHAGFEYQVHASLYPVTSKYVFQDVLIGA
jgi:hypothetical protein